MKKFYVTYYWLEMFGGRSETKAIECPTKQHMIDCAHDIVSVNGIRNVRLNLCGRPPKKSLIIPYEDYLSGHYTSL